MASKFEAFKTARFGYDQLQSLKIPVEWQEEIDIAALKIRSKPFSDKEGFQPVCNRCMNQNALINQIGDFCSVCGHPFMWNCIGFDTLPLVEFMPEANIPLNEVMALIKEEPPKAAPQAKKSAKAPSTKASDGWKEDIYGEQQTLSLAQQHEDEIDNDLFT